MQKEHLFEEESKSGNTQTRKGAMGVNFTNTISFD